MVEGLQHLKRCPAPFGRGTCGSAVFYDWGLQLMDARPVNSIRGGYADRYNDWAQPQQIKICARCTTPYYIEGGELVDLSGELSPEDVKTILTRGQATLPHVKIKDP